MKVYELISLLTEMPAGADVEFAMLMTLADFTKCEVVDQENGKDLYRVSASVKEAVEIDKAHIVLYK